MANLNSVEVSEQAASEVPVWNRAWSRIRGEIDTALVYGATIGSISSLIAFAGILNWCPRCGEWMGPGSEGKGPAAPNKEVPPPPARLLRAISEPIRDKPTLVQELPSRYGGRLNHSVVRGYPELSSPTSGGVTKYSPPSSPGHGQRVDTFTGEFSDDVHGHSVSFVRGDGEETVIADRQYGDSRPPKSPDDVYVTYDPDDGSYTFGFK